MSTMPLTVVRLLMLSWILALSAPALPDEASPGSRDTQRDAASALIVSWAFDESAGSPCLDSSGNGHDASWASQTAPEPARVRGVHGRALRLTSRYQLRVSGAELFDGVSSMSLSAWAMPTNLSRYREIFRKEDGEHRVLFSFQHDGTILSLGLNIGGYVECDAPIQPAEVLDGGWHHCAATFDGRTMRVYLDGREVGSLERPGRIATRPQAPGFIGSSSGTSEFYEGALDELRIYARALSHGEIQSIYQKGVESLEACAVRVNEEIARVYSPGASFAVTLADTRKNLLGAGGAFDPLLTAAILTRLRARFPDDYESFVKWSPKGPLQYLLAPDDGLVKGAARRLVELLVEYRPLTEAQWARQSDEELRQWAEAEKIERRLESLEGLETEADGSNEWIELILAAGRSSQKYLVVLKISWLKPYIINM